MIFERALFQIVHFVSFASPPWIFGPSKQILSSFYPWRPAPLAASRAGHEVAYGKLGTLLWRALEMSGNTFGKLFRVTSFGESHGPAIGCVIDGCPPGMELSTEEIQRDLDRRKPGTSRHVTQRHESDSVEILSGIFEGKTTGTPIALLIRNEDQRSKDYGKIAETFRPGHADYTYWQKYGIRATVAVDALGARDGGASGRGRRCAQVAGREIWCRRQGLSLSLGRSGSLSKMDCGKRESLCRRFRSRA
jgi:hypothetical protein